MSVLGVVIAGGQSRRMGGAEKAFLPLDGLPLIAHVLNRLRPQVDDLVINTNGVPTRFAEFGCAVVPDMLTEIGTPLAGLHAGLNYAVQHGFSAIVSVPSDAPLIPMDLVSRLRGASVIAVSNAQSHYLTGYWDCSLLPELTSALATQNLRRVQDWAKLVHAENVEWPVDPVDPFFNINRPQDLLAAESYLKSSG